MAKKKSGQAAMEFLMTYGWAILVVLVVIGALAYFGILNPESFMPRRCVLGSEIQCIDWKLTTDGNFDIILGNGVANPITITSVAMEDAKFKNLVGSCSVSPTEELNPGERTEILTLTCNGNIPQGTPIRANLVVTYQDRVTTFSHTARGDVVVKAE